MQKFFSTPLAVIIIGLVAWIVAAGCLYEFFIAPKAAELAEQTNIYNENKQYTDPLMLQQANQKVADANTQVAQAESQWSSIQVQKNPDIDLSNTMLAWKQLINELDFYLGPDLEHQLHTTGVTPLTNVTLGGPPNDPNAVLQYASYGYIPIQVQAGGGGGGGGGFAMGPPMGGFGGRGGGMTGPPQFAGRGAPMGGPMGMGGFGGGGGGGGGTIKVEGTFPEILHHIALWNNFNRIALIDGLTLSGNSPNLVGSYNITIYEFPRNADKPGKQVPSSAGTGPGAGGGGMRMGPPGGGAPPGVPGGPGAP